jgi:hypothetical protein
MIYSSCIPAFRDFNRFANKKSKKKIELPEIELSLHGNSLNKNSDEKSKHYNFATIIFRLSIIIPGKQGSTNSTYWGNCPVIYSGVDQWKNNIP